MYFLAVLADEFIFICAVELMVPSLAQAPSTGPARDPSPLFHKVMCLGKICTSKDVFTTNG